MTALNPKASNSERSQATQKPEEVKAYCRCWQSKNFPYCDGSHRQYNATHDDHLGPVLVRMTPEDT